MRVLRTWARVYAGNYKNRNPLKCSYSPGQQTMEEKESRTRVVRQLRGGQITIPAVFRRTLGIEQDTILQMTLVDGELRIKPLQTPRTAAGSAWFQRLYDYFGPVRAEAEERDYSEEEINSAIGQAVAAVRRRHA